jgi:Zn-dependent hydrolases, including glyoxylases
MEQEIIQIDLDGVNCYLGKSEKGFILFDTGGPLVMDKKYRNRRQELLAKLEAAGCRPGNLNAIVLTHGDNDHVTNAAYLREKYHTIIAMHEADLELVNHLTFEKMMESFRYRSPFLTFLFGLLKKKLQKITAKQLEEFTMFQPDVILKDGDSLISYGFLAKVLHLPGHTPGSIGILTDAGDIISGDIWANIKKPVMAPNASDFKKLGNSIDRLMTLPIKKIYPGHGSPFQADSLK